MKKKFSVSKTIIFIFMMLYALTLIFPFVWMFLNSFKGNDEFFKNIWALPTEWKFQHYISVLVDFKITTSAGKFSLLSMFGISIFITVVGTLINVGLSSCAAYVVARYQFPGRKLIYSLAIFIMIVPIVGTLPSQYRIMQALHLYDSFLGIFVLYSGAFGFNFFMAHGFFKSFSWTYAEAAFVDGATDFQVFWKIMLPMAKPSLISLSILHAIGLWNDYVTPSIYLKSYPTLAVGIRLLTSTMASQTKYPEMFATMIIAMLPVLIVFICFQKIIMENTVMGGIKG